MTFMSAAGQAPAPPASVPVPLRMTPGRWVALALAVPVALALIGWAGFGLVASVVHGSYPFSYAFPVHDGTVALNVSAGDIALRQVPGGGTARLTGTVRYGLFRPGIGEFTTSTSANVSSLGCGANFNGSCAVSANLGVPARTGVTLWSNGGDITASGFSSGMTLRAAGGNISVSHLAGTLQLDTGGGDLTANGLAGTLQIGTEGGNVDASGVTAAASTTQSGGGDVDILPALVDPNSPRKITIDSGGGDVTVS